MNKKVLIVEDQFVEANDLQLMLRKAGYDVCGIARSVDIARELIRTEGPGLVLLDIFLKGKQTGIDLARQLKEDNIAFIYLSANSNEEILAAAKTTEPYGFIVKPFREKDLLVTLEIAQYRHEHSRESRYRREAGVLRELEKIGTIDLDWKNKILEAVRIIQQEIPFDYFGVDVADPGTAHASPVGFLRIGFDEYQALGVEELSTIVGTSVERLVRILTANRKESGRAYFNDEEFEVAIARSPQKQLVAETFQMRSLLSYPVHEGLLQTFAVNFYSRRPDSYNAEHLVLLDRLQKILAGIFKVKREAEGVTNSRLVPFEATKSGAPGFEGMIGNSHLLLNVFDLICQVAPFDTSVLVLGESGTGKEKIAECIHSLSPRMRKPLVKVNCATLPASLIESELFGHEKGSSVWEIQAARAIGGSMPSCTG